jgi:hypothetical protein
MERNISFEERIELMKKEAVQVCNSEGNLSPACAVCQDALEEMRAAKYHRDLKIARTTLQQFCLDHYCVV